MSETGANPAGPDTITIKQSGGVIVARSQPTSEGVLTVFNAGHTGVFTSSGVIDSRHAVCVPIPVGQSHWTYQIDCPAGKSWEAPQPWPSPNPKYGAYSLKTVDGTEEVFIVIAEEVEAPVVG